MRAIKEVSRLSGISIRTLRYYDEIGLMKPTKLTAAGYRLYDDAALERLQQIMFFRELEIPLAHIKSILDDPGYDKNQVLLTQLGLLEQKRTRLDRIITLIHDVLKGENTMNFEVFTKEDIEQILDHTLSCMKPEVLSKEIKKHGSLENYRAFLSAGFTNEQAVADIMKWYGSKEKAMEAMLKSTGEDTEIKEQQDLNNAVYLEFMYAKEQQNDTLAAECVQKLDAVYRSMFMLDDAKAILVDLAQEYLQHTKLAEATDTQYGEGCSDYVANAILRYYES